MGVNMQEETKKNAKKDNYANNYTFNVDAILQRLRSLLKINNDMQLSHYLNISQNTIYSWRNRNVIDIQLIVEKIKNVNQKSSIAIDINWLIFGEGIGDIVTSIENSSGIIQKYIYENTELKKELESNRAIINGLIKLLSEQNTENK